MRSFKNSDFRSIALAVLLGLAPSVHAAETETPPPGAPSPRSQAAQNVSVEEGGSIAGAGRFRFSMSTSYKNTQGKFDPYGDYSSYPDGSDVWSVSNSFRLGYRLNDTWELGTGFSVRYTESHFPSGSSVSRSIGNPSLSTRGHFGLGSGYNLSVHVGLSAPYKWRSRHVVGDPTKDIQNDDDSSIGTENGGGNAFSATTGFGIAKRIEPLRLRTSLDASVVHPFASTVDAQDAPAGFNPTNVIQKANQYQLSETFGYPVIRRVGAQLGFRQVWAGDSTSNGVDQQGSASRAFTSHIGFTYSASAAWKFDAKFETPFPFYSYLVNQAYSPTFSIGMSFTDI